MLLSILVLVPIIGIFILCAALTYNVTPHNTKLLKITALAVTIVDLIVSLIIYILFDCSSKQFQFVQEHYEISYFDFYFGVDGLSIYFVLLTTIIIPISIISNWKSIKENTIIFLIIILLLETSLLIVFLVLDILLFYIFFESILAPLFILIGLYGSNEKVRASFYFFLYTLLGSLFMLLSIITMLSLIGSTDFDVLSKTNFLYNTQLFLFYGIFIAFAVKTPTIYLNSWLLKAHVESPLSGSIILAGIVLKLSLYGIVRLILPLLPKAFIYYTYIVFIIGVLTIIYASLSTIRTIDVKELIAYSSVSHAAVYLLGSFSNTLQGIEGGISLGLAHGFVSSGLFICAGGVLYDRSSTRLITYYRGIAQIMPIFAILFFVLSLANCGVPLTLNFVGEFMSLYGVFERLPLAGILASVSIIFSAAYTIFMYNRIAFAGSFFSSFWENYIPDLNKREFNLLLALVIFTVIFGIYPAPILDGMHYSTYSILFKVDTSNVLNIINFDIAEPWGFFFQDNATPQMETLEELHNNIMFYLAIIMFAVTWIFLSIVLNYTKSRISNKYINHGTLVELIWMNIPVLILILIAFPLLYLMDEVLDGVDMCMSETVDMPIDLKRSGHPMRGFLEYQKLGRTTIDIEIHTIYKDGGIWRIMRDLLDTSAVGLQEVYNHTFLWRVEMVDASGQQFTGIAIQGSDVTYEFAQGYQIDPLNKKPFEWQNTYRGSGVRVPKPVGGIWTRSGYLDTGGFKLHCNGRPVEKEEGIMQRDIFAFALPAFRNPS